MDRIVGLRQYSFILANLRQKEKLVRTAIENKIVSENRNPWSICYTLVKKDESKTS